MTQNAMPTWLPATHTGTDIANFTNAAFPALYSYHRGSSRPTYAVPGMIWIDSSVSNVDSIMYWDGTHDILIHSFNTTTGAIVAGGIFSPGNMYHQGVINPTIAAPASPRNGDVYVVGTAGAAHASFTGIAGTAMTVGDVIFYDGTNWIGLKVQSITGSYLPLAGGTLTGNLSFSGPTVSQPFTTILPATTSARLGVKSSSNGGLTIQAASADAISLLANAYAGIPNTSNAAAGAFQLNVGKHNGSGGVAALAANENALSIANNGTTIFLIKGDGDNHVGGSVFTGGYFPLGTEDPGSLTVYTGTADGSALSLLNDDVATPFTSLVPANTYFTIRKSHTDNGGAWLCGFTENIEGLRLTGHGVNASTSPLGGAAPLLFDARKSTGTTSTSYASGEMLFAWTNNSVGRMGLNADGNLFLAGGIATGGEIAPDVSTGGLCLNQGSSSSLIQTWKSSSASHGMTALMETNTFFSGSKVDPTNGGAYLRGFTAGSDAFFVRAYATSVTTGVARGAIHFDAQKKSGTTAIDLAATENILSIGTGSVAKFLVKGNGDTHIVGKFSMTESATTAVGPLSSKVYVPNATGNRGGFAVATYADGSLAGMTAEVVTAGGAGVAVGKLDFWVQNAGATNKVATFDQNGRFGVGIAPYLWGSSFSSVDVYRVPGIFSSTILGGISFNAYNDNSTWRAKVANYCMGFLANTSTGGLTYATSTTAAAAANDAVTLTTRVSVDVLGNVVTTGQIAVATQTTLTANQLVSKAYADANYGGGGGGSSISNGTSSVSIPTANNNIVFTTNGTTHATMQSDGVMSLGRALLDTGSSTSALIDLRGANINHTFTSVANSASFGVLKLLHSTAGGLDISGFTDSGSDVPAVAIRAFSASPGTGVSVGPLDFSAAKSGSAGGASLSATDALATFSNAGTVVTALLGDGSIRTQGEVSADKFKALTWRETSLASGSISVDDAYQNLILDSASTTASYTVTIPLGTSNGQTFHLSTRSAITALTINTKSSQTIYGAATTLPANGFAAYIFFNGTWYRLH